MHGVLHVRQEYPLFEHDAADVVAPHRNARFEPEFGQITGSVRVGCVARTLASAYFDPPVIGEAQLLGEVAEHHNAPERRRERGNQNPVIPAGDHARHCPRRVPAEAVRHEPLARDHRLGVRRVVRWPRNAPKRMQSGHDNLRRARGFTCPTRPRLSPRV